MYLSTNIVFCLFMPQNRPMPEKCGLTVYSISHGHLIFTHIQVGGWGESGGVGKATKQGESPFMAKMQPFIH
jgi:hypothetical protein